jgi:hypothetical protein
MNKDKIMREFKNSLTADELQTLKKFGMFAAKWSLDLEWLYCEIFSE